MKLLEDFFSLLEHLLNTILFTLGGILWGSVVATGEKLGKWTPIDWAYLVMLYVLLHIIRAVLFAAVYPLTSRIGIKSDPKEAIFQVYGGLRGALGIALAIALDNEVAALAGGRFDTEAELHTTQAFVMIGGIAFMTLVINGTTAGPLLRKLGLADSTEARSTIIQTLRVKLRAYAIDDFVRLLAQPRFYHSDFALVKEHVPFLSDLTRTQFLEAVKKYRAANGTESPPPYLKKVLPMLEKDMQASSKQLSQHLEEEITDEQILADFDNYVRQARHRIRKKKRHRRHSSNIRAMLGQDALSVQESRLLFVSILRAQYEKQVDRGELDNQHFLTIAFDQSLDFASHDIQKGRPLQDWRHLTEIHDPMITWEARLEKSKRVLSCCKRKNTDVVKIPSRVIRETLMIERAMAFMAAHENAQKVFSFEVEDVDHTLTESGKLVIQESLEQYALAQVSLKNYNPDLLQRTASSKLCKILLNMTMHHVEKMVHMGSLKESEAEHLLEEYMEYLEDLELAARDERRPAQVESTIFEDVPNPLLQQNPKLVSRIENLMHEVGPRRASLLLEKQEEEPTMPV